MRASVEPEKNRASDDAHPAQDTMVCRSGVNSEHSPIQLRKHVAQPRQAMPAAKLPQGKMTHGRVSELI